MANITYVRTERYNVTEAIPRAMEAAEGIFEQITVLGWNRDGVEPPPMPSSDRATTEYFDSPMPAGGAARARATASFMRWVTRRLRRSRPEFVQAFDMFAALPSGWACARSRAICIYDVRDPFSLSYPFPRFVRPAAHSVDWLTMALSKAFVVPLEERVAYLGRWAARRPVCVIRNTCHDQLSELERPPFLTARSASHTIRIAYLGYVAPSRGASLLLDLCAREDDGAELWSAGTCRSEELRSRLESTPGSHWLGLVPRRQALGLMREADAVALLYDPAVPVNRIAAPNKFYEALMTGTPVLVSRGMSLAATVEAEGLGFAIDYGDPDALRRAVAALRDADRRRDLRQRCRDYFLAHCTLGEELERYRAFYRSLLGQVS